MVKEAGDYGLINIVNWEHEVTENTRRRSGDPDSTTATGGGATGSLERSIQWSG